MKNGGGQFAPKSGGHFELESGGHFKLELGGQDNWNLHSNTSWALPRGSLFVSFTCTKIAPSPGVTKTLLPVASFR